MTDLTHHDADRADQAAREVHEERKQMTPEQRRWLDLALKADVLAEKIRFYTSPSKPSWIGVKADPAIATRVGKFAAELEQVIRQIDRDPNPFSNTVLTMPELKQISADRIAELRQSIETCEKVHGLSDEAVARHLHIIGGGKVML